MEIPPIQFSFISKAPVRESALPLLKTSLLTAKYKTFLSPLLQITPSTTDQSDKSFQTYIFKTTSPTDLKCKHKMAAPWSCTGRDVLSVTWIYNTEQLSQLQCNIFYTGLLFHNAPHYWSDSTDINRIIKKQIRDKQPFCVINSLICATDNIRRTQSCINTGLPRPGWFHIGLTDWHKLQCSGKLLEVTS